MKVTAVRLRRVALELDPPFEAAWDPAPRRRFEATLVYVETDEGLTGVGSGDSMDGFRTYEHLFLDQDALDVERHARVIETISFHAGRYWPLEAAFWDLLGKAQGVPVATLLGGSADRLPAYASTGSIRPPAESAELALRLREEGFRALKMRVEPPALEEGLARVTAVREAVGDGMDLMVDLNQGWRMPGDVTPPWPYDDVRRFADGLAELGVRWLEEPLHGEDVSGLARLRDETAVPLAGGEMARTPALLDAYVEAGSLDVLQPDAVLAVGIAGARDLARKVLAHGLAFTPHTWTNGIGLLANLHLTAGVGGGPYLEFPYDPDGWTPERRDFMLARPVVCEDGLLAVPDAPGLGIEPAAV